MIENELILLGLLKESPKHGYEIKKKIKEILALFSGVDLKSIYYPLRILEKEDLVTQKTAKSGRRPQRFVYALTQKGEKRFEELLTKSLLNFKRPQFSLDLSLYFLAYMKPDIVKRRLRARALILDKLSRNLRHTVESLGKKKPSSLAYILEHDLQMVEAEARFLSKLIKNL
ncbi:MAG: PadR family transcriptional regulator [Candidatus Omnitrophica bacterium]|nr:PadR family transcriptional regulator [Candidatus Omnitrophota bacterium]